MKWDHHLALSWNHWGMKHAFLVQFLSNQALYLALVVALVVFVVSMRSTLGMELFKAKGLLYAIKSGFLEIVIPVAIAAIVSETISTTYVRPRPFISLPGIHLLISHSADGGMPSHHTVFIVALGASLIPLAKRVGIAMIALGVACGIARIAAGAHYPTDIAVASILGFLLPWLYFRIFKRRLLIKF
jgi:membrane-associated phospholipid phosphatase